MSDEQNLGPLTAEAVEELAVTIQAHDSLAEATGDPDGYYVNERAALQESLNRCADLAEWVGNWPRDPHTGADALHHGYVGAQREVYDLIGGVHELIGGPQS